MAHVDHERPRHRSTGKTVERRADMLKRREVNTATDLLLQPNIAINVLRSKTPTDPATPEELLETGRGTSQQSGTIDPSKTRRVP